MSDILNNALQQPASGASTIQGPSEEVQKELRTRFELLPEELQTVITSSDYQMKLFELAKKYKMTYEKLGSLELETTLVLLGMTHPRDFASEVKGLLKLGDEDFTNLMKDIQAQVFDPIKTGLHKVYEDDEDEDTPASEALSKNETSVMTKAGVDVGPMGAPKVTPTDVRAESLKQADLMQAIENPTKSTATILNPLMKPSSATPVEPTVQKTTVPANESMQDSINKLLTKTDAEVKSAAVSIEDTLNAKLGTTQVASVTAPTPDMPPLAPTEAANRIPTGVTQTAKVVDTIIPIKKTSVDMPLVQYDTSGKVIDPYKEQI